LCYQEIQVAVLIKIDKRRAQTNRFQFIQSSLHCYVFELTGDRITEEMLLADARDEQVWDAVVVEIGHATAEAWARAGQSSLERDVREYTAAIISQQEILNLTVHEHSTGEE